MSDSTTPIPLKRCTKCGNEYPAMKEYFQAHKQQKSGLRPECKKCSQSFKKANWERYRETTWRQYYEANRQILSDRFRAWRLNNLDYARERVRTHYHGGYKLKKRGLSRQWRLNNADYVANKHRLYRNANRRQFQVYSETRRARELNLPATLTPQQWKDCLTYFSHCCAICGRPRGLWHTIAQDHWIPVSNPACTGTVVDNIIPLCHATKDGEAGCNNSKHDKMPDEWLAQIFGRRKANQILKRINAYFAQVRNQS